MSSKVEDFVEYHEEKTRAERDPEEHEREEQEEEERERKSKGKKSKSKEKEDESEHEKKERLKAEKEEEERERAEDEAREKKENSQHEGEESQHDKDKTKAEKEAEEREHAEDEAREKKEKQEDEHEGEKDEVEDAERKGKKRPLAQRIVSAAEEKYSLVWQMYLRYNVSWRGIWPLSVMSSFHRFQKCTGIVRSFLYRCTDRFGTCGQRYGESFPVEILMKIDIAEHAMFFSGWWSKRSKMA